MKSEITSQATPAADQDKRATELLESFQRTIHCRTDRMFAVLMSLQWLGGIVLALTVSPTTWIGDQSQVHLHVWAAIFLGGVITAFPVALAVTRPGQPFTRHVIAVGQMLTSGLLIHLSGGRIETHFHVFGSLAFLAFYRDAKVLVPATLVVALDHFFRGIYWPQSVYGVINAGTWRWFEHSLWVLFEDFFLFLSIRKSVAELHGIAGQQAQLESTNVTIERRVEERTADLKKSQALLKEACEAAEAANVTKSTFLANMSHEIRTPMTAIIGYTELIKERMVDLGAEDTLKDLKVVERSSAHLMQLINDLLDLSKIEAGQLEVERIDCSPLQIISDVLSVVSVRASEKGIHLFFHAETPVPDQIISDPIRLRQALLNLVGNAVKFTEVGSVAIILRISGDGNFRKFEFEVKDTGIGIPADRIKDLFKPFHQVDASTTRKYGGTGLGLAVSNYIVKVLGGDIIVKSAEGVGSSFTLRLGIEIPAGAQFLNSPSVRAMKCDSAVSATRKHNLSARILVVEDNLENQNLISTHLARCGAEVSLAEDGSVGLKKCSEGKYDLVVMDIQMPVLDGFETLAALRRQGIAVPVIALTAHAMKGDRERCLAAGFDEYLAKPVTGQELYEAVKQLLEKKGRPAPAKV